MTSNMSSDESGIERLKTHLITGLNEFTDKFEKNQQAQEERERQRRSEVQKVTTEKRKMMTQNRQLTNQNKHWRRECRNEKALRVNSDSKFKMERKAKNALRKKCDGMTDDFKMVAKIRKDRRKLDEKEDAIVDKYEEPSKRRGRAARRRHYAEGQNQLQHGIVDEVGVWRGHFVVLECN